MQARNGLVRAAPGHRSSVDRTAARASSGRADRARIAVLFAGVVAVDQVTKALAHVVGSRHAVEPIENSEYALGLVGGPPVILICGTLIAITAVAGYSHRRSDVQPWWILPIFAAGAVSNLADRIALGEVRDFLPTPWLVFNLADVAILLGVGAFYRTILLRRYRSRSRQGGR